MGTSLEEVDVVREEEDAGGSSGNEVACFWRSLDGSV